MAAKRTIDADIVWDGGMTFVARTGSHHFLTIDTTEENGGANSGPGPMEMVACALGGCAAMDVISILQKKRKTVTSLNVQVTGNRRSEQPAVFDEVVLDFRVSGPDVSEEDIGQAVELSLEKYCSVAAMLYPHVRINPKWTLEPST
ncbi:MAG: OsmC family protein [Candidatus Zixiibacteriota bacterium]